MGKRDPEPEEALLVEVDSVLMDSLGVFFSLMRRTELELLAELVPLLLVTGRAAGTGGRIGGT
jgi:hypothetical protein